MDAKNSNESGALSAFQAADLYRMQVREMRNYAMFTLDPAGFITSWNAGVKELRPKEINVMFRQTGSMKHSTTSSRRPRVGQPAILRLTLGMLMATVSVSAQAAKDCSNLTAVTTVDATITAAAVVDPPATIGGAAVSVSFCRVQGVARPSSDSEIKFEVWLPPTAAGWSKRLKVNGTGAYNGAIPYARLAQDVGDSFVSAGSNWATMAGNRRAGRSIAPRRSRTGACERTTR